ncbi:preprotein translocase subunit SecE [Rhodococcus sp. NPDC058481]|uniref:preprotein translocase subunit SecE n=1 Tax=unclassified Rhodococcus (in: high G+C Gram-positive bacteria) TaxID=192944 RepID=UPI0036460634
MSEDRGKADSAAGSPDVDATSAGASDSAPVASRPTGKRPGRRTNAAQASTESTAAKGAGTPVATKAKPEKPRKENLFKRLRKFLREVIAELRKVIWPNRKQMITYTTVVLVFVAFMVAFISGLDLAFIKGVSWLFG